MCMEGGFYYLLVFFCVLLLERLLFSHFKKYSFNT